MRRLELLYWLPLVTLTVSCADSPPKQAVNHAARFAAASEPSAQYSCLRDILALEQSEASRILGQIDSANLLIAVDDQLNCLFHSNADGTTYNASPNNQGGSNGVGRGKKIEELRWLAWSEGQPFGFSHHRYSHGKRTLSWVWEKDLRQVVFVPAAAAAAHGDAAFVGNLF